MIDDRIKLLSERIERERPPPARVQRLLVKLIAEMVEEAVEARSAPLYVYHPFDAPLPLNEAVRRRIERMEERLTSLRAYAEERGLTDIVTIIDGPVIG